MLVQGAMRWPEVITVGADKCYEREEKLFTRARGTDAKRLREALVHCASARR